MQALIELREQRNKLLSDMKALADKVIVDEKRGFNDSEEAQSRKMQEEMAQLEQRISYLTEVAKREQAIKADEENHSYQKRELAKVAPAEVVKRAQSYEELEKRYTEIFETKLVRMQSLTSDERQVVVNYRAPGGTNVNIVGTGQITGDDALGGIVIPRDHLKRIIACMKLAGPFPGVGLMVGTDTTGVFEIPVTDDTSVEAQWPGEGQQINVQDMEFSAVRLNAYPLPTLVQASWRMISDGQFDFGAWLPQALGERIGRALNNACTTGNGTNKPTGFITTLAASGVAAGAAGALALDDITKLYFSVDAGYRQRPTAGFMMNSQTLASIVSLTLGKTNDQLIYTPSQELGEPSRIMGVPIYLNEYMPDVGTGNASVAFGDWQDGYAVRMVNGITLQVLRERYADIGAYGFLAYTHVDGHVMSSCALNVLVHP